MLDMSGLLVYRAITWQRHDLFFQKVLFEEVLAPSFSVQVNALVEVEYWSEALASTLISNVPVSLFRSSPIAVKLYLLIETGLYKK